ncbi:MAG: gas vesicle protein GvpG [Pseudomonadota bacterium]
MGLIRALLTFPVSAPIKGSWWLAEQIETAAMDELTDPTAIRRALAELEAQLEAGDLDEARFEELELILLERLRGAR